MRPNQLWLDLSHGDLRVWVDEKLMLAHAKGGPPHRLGFHQEIPLFHLGAESARPQGWTSFRWEDAQGKFPLEENFWITLEAARFDLLAERPGQHPLQPPLGIDFPLASEVLFFAGSFNPWHEGHQACVDLAPPELPLIVCPDHNPFKTSSRHKDALAFYLSFREAMRVPEGRTCLPYPGFLLRDCANPTVEWVLRLKRHRPDLRVSLLMGYDSLKALPTWIQAGELVKLLHGLYVVSRGEEETDHAADAAWLESKVRFLGRHAHEGVSSTGLRSPGTAN